MVDKPDQHLWANPRSVREYYMDIETTGLRFNFGGREQPVGLIQVALGELRGNKQSGLKTRDFWTDVSSEHFQQYLEGKFGKGEQASRELLRRLMDTESETPWQQGVLSMIDPRQATPQEKKNENVVAGVLRRHLQVQYDDWKTGRKKVHRAEQAALGSYAQISGASTDDILTQIKKITDDPRSILKGWNFSYDMGEIVKQARTLGRKDVVSSIDKAFRQGRIVDSAQGWYDILFSQSVYRPGKQDLSLFHRKRNSGGLSRSQLEKQLEDIDVRIQKGMDFKPLDPSKPTGRVVEPHGGFHKWLFGDEPLVEEFRARGLIEEGDLKSYERFERRMLELTARDPRLLEEKARRYHEKFRGIVNQSFRKGQVTPDMKYVGLWSLDVISGALGLKDQLQMQGPQSAVRQGLNEAHDGAVDNLIARRVEDMSRVFTLAGDQFDKDLAVHGGKLPMAERINFQMSALDDHLRRNYSVIIDGKRQKLTRQMFFERLQLFGERSALNKALESKTLQNESFDRIAQVLAKMFPVGDLQPTDLGNAPVTPGAKSVKQAANAVGRELQEKFLNVWKNPIGKVGVIGAGVAVAHSLWAEAVPTSRANPETGEPMLSSREIKALPPTIRGNYLHGLLQSELSRRGLVSGIEVPVETAEGRGYIDAMSRAGYPIEIKATSHVGGPRSSHVRQLRKYLQATGRSSGQLYYVDYEQGPGVISSYGIEGLRHTESRYEDYHGIMPGAANVSDFRSGRSWYSQLRTALKLQADAHPRRSRVEQHALHSLNWAKSVREDKLLAEGAIDTGAGLVSDLQSYLPRNAQHKMMIDPHEVISGGARGAHEVNHSEWAGRLKHLAQDRGMTLRGLGDPGPYKTKHRVARAITEKARTGGSLINIPVPLTGGGIPRTSFNILSQPRYPSRLGSLIDGKVALGTGPAWTMNRLPDPKQLLTSKGTIATQHVYVPKVTRPDVPNITGPRPRVDISGPDIQPGWGIKGPWSSQISGINKGQFDQGYVPWSSPMHTPGMMVEQQAPTVLGMNPTVAMSVQGGLFLGGMVSMMLENTRVLDLKGTPWAHPNILQEMFDFMQKVDQINPHRARKLLARAGINEEVVKGLRMLDGYDPPGKEVAKAGTWLGKIKSMPERISGWAKNIGAWGRYKRAHPETFRYPGMTAFRKRLSQRLMWASGGPDALTMAQRAKNMILMGGLGMNYDDFADVAEAAKNVHRGPDGQVLKDKNVFNHMGRTKTLFGSRSLAEARDRFVVEALEKRAAKVDDLIRGIEHAGGKRSTNQTIKNLTKRSSFLKGAAKTAGRASTANILMGVGEVFFWAMETEERANRLGGGIQGIALGGLAASFTSAGHIVGGVIGSAFGGFLGSVAGSVMLGAVGSLMGDAIESLGASILGKPKIDRHTSMVQAASKNPYRDYYTSHIPSLGREADGIWGTPSMHTQHDRFGSPWRVPSTLRHPEPALQVRKLVRPPAAPMYNQNLYKMRKRSSIRDQRSRLGWAQASGRTHYNGSHQGVSVVPHQ